MDNPVIVLRTQLVLRAARLCEELVWRNISFHFTVEGMSFLVTVDERHAKTAQAVVQFNEATRRLS